MLVNTAGHSNMVFDFAALFKTTYLDLQTGLVPKSSMFAYGDHIYSVFAFRNKVIIYQDTDFAKELDIDVSLNSMEVLEMVVDRNNLIILTKHQNTLKSYQIDFSSQLSVSPLESKSTTDK
jgi:hypothetical protein